MFALIGPEAIPMLARYIADAGNRESPRIAAADGLRAIALMHPGTREQVVAHLTKQLETYEDNRQDLNAFLVTNLLDLKATESAELIERAYAACRVDQWIAGSWAAARQELGVPGMGLAPDGPPEPERVFPIPAGSLGAPRRANVQASGKNKKSKRKSQKQARNRSRKKK